jgi:DUF1365 family protein
VVLHRRAGRNPHQFRYRVILPLLFLDEADEISRRHPLWDLGDVTGGAPARRGPAAVRLRRHDYLGPEPRDLAEAARLTVARATGARPAGPVAVLTHVRTWGWLFNPITLYFCYDGSGSAVEAMVVEVTNTPWHERHTYVVGPPGQHRLDKAMHVSPFQPMEAGYVLAYDEPGDRITITMGMRSTTGLVDGEPGDELLDARMDLHRRPMDREAMGRLLWRYPLMTARVSAAIYAQAGLLRWKGAQFHPHPRHSDAARPSEMSHGA